MQKKELPGERCAASPANSNHQTVATACYDTTGAEPCQHPDCVCVHLLHLLEQAQRQADYHAFVAARFPEKAREHRHFQRAACDICRAVSQALAVKHAAAGGEA